MGYRADVVSNGSEAVAAVTNVPYDVALGAFLDARSRHKGKM